MQDIEQEVLTSIRQLPSLPAVTARILEMVNNPGTHPNEIGEVLALDPALTAKVLQLVNSAFFGLRKRVTSVGQAIIYLGLNTIKNLVLTASVFDAVKSRKKSAEIFQELMTHAILAGFAGTAIARKLKMRDESEFFTYGLMHDLGKVILLTQLPERFVSVYQTVHARQTLFYTAEQELLSHPHPELAALLFEQWKLPEALIDAVRHHHNPRNAPLTARKGAAAAHAASWAAIQSRLAGNLDMEKKRPDTYIEETLLLSVQDLRVIGNELRRDFDAAKSFLQILSK